ncbi:hypothetical protein [Candidatus Tisiphia endosymbiont of Hybos culiciformis]|uniref:hypothetical protein n=1 Tax=Candidatus Tisiphia endosymbiont of Hybos culiciformis TaxID=3139331 RepID=UPI003CCAC52C
MKNIFYTEFWRKYYPVILCFVLMFLHFLSAYPGGMSFDSFYQYEQSISGNYFSHHPPLMSMVWSLLNHIYQGPQVMLLLHLVFLWGGILLLFYADPQNKYRYLYFVIPFLPNILAQSGIIWKDIGFAVGSFFVVASCVFYIYHQNRPSCLTVIGLLLVIFYVVGVKFQAQFIAPILVFFVLSVYLKAIADPANIMPSSQTSLREATLVATKQSTKVTRNGLLRRASLLLAMTDVSLLWLNASRVSYNWFIRIIITTILSLLIIEGNNQLAKHFSTDSHAKQVRLLFDMAGISVEIDNDDVLPDYVKENKIYSFEKLKALYTPGLVNYLVSGDNGIYNSTSDPIKLQEMESSYIRAVIHHPLAFLKHRMKNFILLMKESGYYNNDLLIDPNEAQKYGIYLKKNHVKNLMISYLDAFPRVVTKNFISFILIFVYLIAILTNKQSNNPEKAILIYVVAIGLVFSVVLFFVTMACDYRYYYVIRVLTLFSLPIYLKLRHCKAKNVVYS